MAKETYSYDKRGPLEEALDYISPSSDEGEQVLRQKRPIYIAKIGALYGKRDLFI